MVRSSKDESCCKLLHIELNLHLVICDGTFCLRAGLVGACLNPMRSVPSHKTCFEVRFLCTGCRFAFIVSYGDTPIITRLGRRRETTSLNEHAFVRIDSSRFPYDIAKTGVTGNLYIVACLHHTTQLTLQLPREMDIALVYADWIVIVLGTKSRNIESKSR